MTWDKDALWSKSKGYVERALQEDRNNEMFPFWLSLSLELLARAAVSSIHPLLLAEPNKDDPTNILHALGRPTGKGKPKSLAISGVFKLCRHLVPGFTEEDLRSAPRWQISETKNFTAARSRLPSCLRQAG